MRVAHLNLVVIAVAVLSACGGDDLRDDRRVEDALMLHVRAAGMVKSLGIT